MRQRAMHSAGGTTAALSLRRWLAVWLLLALCLAPLVARMHQVVHIPGAGLAPAVATTAPSLPAVSPGGVGHTVQALFGHHGSLDCQALDQLAHGQAPLASLSWLPACWATVVSLAAPVHALASQRWWAPLGPGAARDAPAPWFLIRLVRLEASAMRGPCCGWCVLRRMFRLPCTAAGPLRLLMAQRACRAGLPPGSEPFKSRAACAHTVRMGLLTI